MRILPPGLEDAALGMAAHMKCTHLQFRHLLNRHVIGYSSNTHSGFALLARKLHLLDHPGKGQRRPVGATHEQPLHHLAEGGVALSDQKPVELGQQP